MLVDSHCHLDRVDLTPYQGDFKRLMEQTLDQGVGKILSVSINLEAYPAMLALVAAYPGISISVGVHPCEQAGEDPEIETLIELARHPKNVAIGETGLDYYRSQNEDMAWQRERFRRHIRAARVLRKPLIIHTREARQDTIHIMREEKAEEVGGVMHCFTETWEMAKEAMAMNFYLSFSGILTFKNAQALKDVAAQTPMERILIETDAPYLAPTPFRGKPNEPRHVVRVAEQLAEIKNQPVENIIQQTHDNYCRLFGVDERLSLLDLVAPKSFRWKRKSPEIPQ